ncbi:hypothetical protein BDZ97DRAFT_427436 [Flammula alnicola]|nr:hypothetical protein BDZ97DRAFT_427436 [Flammula alnicola]
MIMNLVIIPTTRTMTLIMKRTNESNSFASGKPSSRTRSFPKVPKFSMQSHSGERSLLKKSNRFYATFENAIASHTPAPSVIFNSEYKGPLTPLIDTYLGLSIAGYALRSVHNTQSLMSDDVDEMVNLMKETKYLPILIPQYALSICIAQRAYIYTYVSRDINFSRLKYSIR